jgi:hypothetical protein
MPIHDWTRVDAGIFHHFHHRWITSISDALNEGVLPPEYYALAEQQAVGFGPDVLTLQSTRPDEDEDTPEGGGTPGAAGLLLAPPKVRFKAESSKEFYRRKKSMIAIRHVSKDDVVALIEILSPGNKGNKNAFKALTEKAYELLEHKIHLLLLDLFPPSKRDPHGIHAVLWEDIAEEEFTPPPDKPLTLASYMSDLTVKAYVEAVAVGDPLPDMPLFLEPNGYVLVPLEATYRSAFAAVPRRWRRVLDPSA